MPEPNNVPLQKELFHINLAKGVNERDRPETADPSSTLTRVENLYQEQAGAWVKRPGTPLLGAELTNPTKLVRLREGLGLIGNSGRFYHYQEALGAWLDKDEFPEFTASADFITGSGQNVAASVLGTASCTNFHALVINDGADVCLVIYDRLAAAVVARYYVARDMSATGTPKIVFVGDRYLHVYVTVMNLSGFVIDTHAAMPTTITLTALDASGTTPIDIAAHTDRSIVLYTRAGVKNIASMSNAAAFIEKQAVAGALQISNSGTKLWYMTAVDLAANDPAALTSNLVVAAAHGATSGGYMTSTVANRVYYAVQTAATTFGSTTINTINISVTAVNGTTLVANQAIDGWVLASAPFLAASDKVFLHVTKDSGLAVTPHAVLNIVTGTYNTNTLDGNAYYSTKIACGLEPHIGVANSTVLRYQSPNPVVAIQTTARGFGYAAFQLDAYGYADSGFAQFGGATHISGGCHSSYAGDHIYESGFHDFPKVNTASSSTGITGAFKYIAVHRFMDETGSVTWSRTSPVSSITVSNKTITATISPANVTNRDKRFSAAVGGYFLGAVELYRTATGGTQYYLVNSNAVGTPATGLATQAIALSASRFFTAVDVMTDAVLITQPTLFRQPGTANAAVDRYPPPCGNPLIQHKDRLFTTDPYGMRVYYSSFFVDGENAWFNPAFSFFVHGASGPITGLASMDGRLVVFKRNGIFVVDGDGPPEGGPNGSEYSPPQRLATEFGCIDHRSIALSTEGLVYKSDRGVELLTRSLQVKWLGENVQTTVDANPKVCGATIDTVGRYHLCLAASDTGTATQAGIQGPELVYEFTTGAWSVSYHSNLSGTYGRCLQDICRADIYGYGEVVCYIDPAGVVTREDFTTGLDRALWYVPWTVETAWVRTGQQNRARFSKAMLLAKKLAGANHSITVSAAYDYVDSYTQVGVFEPDQINGAPMEELMQNLNRPEVLAVRLLFEEGPPSDVTVYPVGTARGCDLLGIGLEVAQKTGAPKLAAGQKV